MKTSRNHLKGFTLIELIVVLAVFGLILAIAVPNYLGVQNTSELRADLVTVGMIEKSEDHYHAINQAHSFDESAEQSTYNFQDSLDNLASLIDPVKFHMLTNVHWAKEDTHWYVAYDTTSSGGDEAPVEEEELPDHPEWDPNQDQYNGGDRVIYQGRVFEALYWTRDEPGILGNPWNEITDEWRNFNEYRANAIVKYNGLTYRAKWWSKNEPPGSAAVWALVE